MKNHQLVLNYHSEITHKIVKFMCKKKFDNLTYSDIEDKEHIMFNNILDEKYNCYICNFSMNEFNNFNYLKVIRIHLYKRIEYEYIFEYNNMSIDKKTKEMLDNITIEFLKKTIASIIDNMTFFDKDLLYRLVRKL